MTKDHKRQGAVSSMIVIMFIVLVTIACCSGCSTVVPVVAKFPDAPKFGLGTCPQLQTVNEGVKLSELTKTVTVNYGTYYECAIKADQWNEWYQIQKNIFENVK